MYVIAFICTSFEAKPSFWWNCQRQKIYSCKINNDGIYYGVNIIFRKDAHIDARFECGRELDK